MNKTVLLILSFAWLQTIAQEPARTPAANPKLIGIIRRAELEKEPYKAWFTAQYDHYTVQTGIIAPFASKLRQKQIIIFMGTWCGDTRREIPRFLRILDEMNFPSENLKLVCLDNETPFYKQCPGNPEKGLGIHRVPTVLVMDNGTEAGRITEFPVISLEQDLTNILNRARPKSNYSIATLLASYAENGRMNEVESRADELAGEWRNQITSSAELNTLGYVLMGKKLLKEAIIVLKINTKLYPETANTYDSLGEAYTLHMEHDQAIRCYRKVLQLKPNDPHALEKLQELEK